jgi:hypothetical protein
MAVTGYQRKFKHDDWIDNQDVVQADGERGFNPKFHALEDEFDAIAKAIGDLAAAIVPVPSRMTLTFAPSFFPNQSAPAWSMNNGIASKATGQTGADGWMPLQLPDRLYVKVVTVVGQNSGNVGSFVVQLLRQGLGGGALDTLLALPLAEQAGPFQVPREVTSALNQVDNSAYKYLLTARVIGADAGATAQLMAVQIACSRT